MGGSLPILPLRDVVVLPGTPMPLIVGRPGSVAAVQAAEAASGQVLLVTQRHGDVVEPREADLHEVGTVASLEEVIALPDGHLKVMLLGASRARLGPVTMDGSARMLRCTPEPMAAQGLDHPDLGAMVRMLRESVGRVLRLDPSAPAEMLARVEDTPDPEALADLLAATLQLSMEERQALLAEPDVKQRLETLLAAMQKELGFLEVQRKLRHRVDRDRERRAEEAWLADGTSSDTPRDEPDNDDRDDLADLVGLLRDKELPEEVRGRAERELRRLGRMNPMSAEAAVLRAWLDWVVQVPWVERSERLGDLKGAAAVLDEDHFGLDSVKERVLEHLAVDLLAPDAHAPILCLVGPPGVGKTSLARSIARATGRPFARIALGGVRDEAEIRGHRRTYIGALPGRILHAMKRAGTTDALLLLDEVDKMASDVRGDPASALLEVLDPEQNGQFSDHYLDLDYDLSSVMFVCTANRLDDIPLPLRDRLEILELGGYTEPEKRSIAQRYLVPRQRSQSGLPEDALTITDDALALLIRRYTREAGVRNLEREIGRLCRKRARARLEHDDTASITVDPDTVVDLLGPPRFDPRVADDQAEVGVVRGLSVGYAGGELLEIEVALVPGSGKLRTTGRAGEVLKESAEAARTWLRARHARFGLPADWHETTDLHIHYPGLPSGVEGPSAGIAMATALVSAATGRSVRAEVAMTGEISLRGRVLPVGGIKDKVLAAWRGGSRLVVLPARNERDLRDVPEDVRAALDIRLVSMVDEVLDLSLLDADPDGSSEHVGAWSASDAPQKRPEGDRSGGSVLDAPRLGVKSRGADDAQGG